MSEIDASVFEQIVRRLRFLARLEICGRAYNSGTMVLRYADRDHILLDVFSEVDTGIEAARDDIQSAVIGGDIEHDVRAILRKLR